MKHYPGQRAEEKRTCRRALSRQLWQAQLFLHNRQCADIQSQAMLAATRSRYGIDEPINPLREPGRPVFRA